MTRETIIVVDLQGGKGLIILVGALVAVGLLLFLALPARNAAATAREASVDQSGGMRQFYLSEDTVTGDSPLAQCAAGFHMASLWEVADPTNLRYNPFLGQTAADSGQGPPSDRLGWVRTAYQFPDNSSSPGKANCQIWSATVGYGTVVNLVDYWTSGAQDMEVWNAGADGCTLSRAVWCVED